MAPPPFYPMETSPEERDAVCEILPKQLYLTNWRGAENKAALQAMGVTHIAAVGSEFLDDDDDTLVYWRKDITDDDHQQEEMAAAMIEGAAFCHKAISCGGCVLVHCAAGMSRSVTVVLAYLMLHTSRTLRESFALCHSSRPGVWPNDGFMAVLIAKEVSLKGGESTIELSEYVEWGDYEASGDTDQAEDELRPSVPRLQRGETRVDAEEREQYRTERGLSSSTIGGSSSDMLAVEPQRVSTGSSGRRGSLTREDLKAQKMEAELAAKAARGRRPSA